MAAPIRAAFPWRSAARMPRGARAARRRKADKVCPAWANWSGDPFYDLYSHAAPGTQEHYSSAGFWRMGQALTYVWDRDLKDVLDERLFGKIGIAPGSWDWYNGETVQSQKYFYPTIPDSYTYLDPPYRINGTWCAAAPAGQSCALPTSPVSDTCSPRRASGKASISSTPNGCAATAAATAAASAAKAPTTPPSPKLPPRASTTSIPAQRPASSPSTFSQGPCRCKTVIG